MAKNRTKEEQKRLNEELFDAVISNNLSAVKAAVESGAFVNVKDTWDKTILEESIFADIAITKYLLKNGANPNIQDTYGDTALHHAISYTCLEQVKLLLTYNADMYIKNNNNRTPFKVAVTERLYQINNPADLLSDVAVMDNFKAAELLVLRGYIPSDEDFNNILDLIKREIIKTRFMTLAAQVQEHRERLTEEAETTSQEFAYADEIIEM